MGYFQPTSRERTFQKTLWSIINLLVFRFNYMQSLALQQVHKQPSFVDQRFYSKKRASNLAKTLNKKQIHSDMLKMTSKHLQYHQKSRNCKNELIPLTA